MQRHSQSPRPSSTKLILRMVGGTVPRARCKKYHKKGDTLACTALFVIRWLQAAPSSLRIQCSTTVFACQGGSEKKMRGWIAADCTRRQAQRSTEGQPRTRVHTKSYFVRRAQKSGVSQAGKPPATQDTFFARELIAALPPGAVARREEVQLYKMRDFVCTRACIQAARRRQNQA